MTASSGNRLLALARAGNLAAFATGLAAAADDTTVTSAAVASIGPALGLTGPLVNGWAAVDVV